MTFVLLGSGSAMGSSRWTGSALLACGLCPILGKRRRIPDGSDVGDVADDAVEEGFDLHGCLFARCRASGLVMLNVAHHTQPSFNVLGKIEIICFIINLDSMGANSPVSTSPVAFQKALHLMMCNPCLTGNNQFPDGS